MADIRIIPASGSIYTTGSFNFVTSGSATTSSVYAVDGNNGRLFEITDDLSNSLFSVNTIAGIPVIEAFANQTVFISGSLYGGNLAYTGTFSSVSSVTITHNLGTKNVIVQCYDNTDTMFIPSSVVTTDINNVTITFASSRTGRAVISK